MAGDFKISDLNNVPATGPQVQAKEAKAKSDKNVTGKEDFLNLLVHQLQNQDPLDPMKSEEFAVQLATFSQLEQLIEINGKLDSGAAGGGAGSVGTMASYLGQQVVLGDSPVTMKGGKGPDLLVKMPDGARAARIDFLNDQGQIVGSKQLPEVLAGEQALSLEGVNVSNGDYDVRVTAVSANGQFVDVPSKVTGVVDGFVIQPEPALIVNGQQVTVDKVTQVSKPVQKAS